MTCQTIPPSKLYERWQADPDVTVIDVRTPVEFRAVRLPMARPAPLDRLEPIDLLDRLKPDRDRPVYLVCQSGARAAKACAKLRAAGCDHVVCVEGGTDAWVRAGYDVHGDGSTFSLERQVRIAAGTLALAGTALGAAVSGWFYLVPAFVGFGLIFAGITDWCGMGMLLAKMPWNR